LENQSCYVISKNITKDYRLECMFLSFADIDSMGERPFQISALSRKILYFDSALEVRE
jgi:hypothetical protein